MRLLKIIPLFLVTFMALAAVAHGTGPHLMGTVKAIDASSITIEAKDGQATTAAIDANTKFEKSDKPAKREDVAVGEKVVMHTNKTGDKLTALMVKFGEPEKH